MTKRIEDLVVGDKVVVDQHNSAWYHSALSVETVTKVTDKQLTLSNGKRYLKRTGNEIGNDTYGTYIRFNYTFYRLMTPEEAEEEIREREAGKKVKEIANKLGAFKWQSLPLEVLEAISTIVDENDPNQKKE